MESQMKATGAAEDLGSDDEYVSRARACGRSLMDVLMPAHPPEPKNARVIRLFDIEGAKNDPQPLEYVSAAAVRREARSGRRASREQRGTSLLAAAGLV
jgi:hypothetical protein